VRGGSETILVADDDPNIRKMTKELLEIYGYSVLEAGDGVESVSKYLENKEIIDLALLDVVMPRKSGKEAFEEIRTAVPGAKVLFCSGYSGDVLQMKKIIDSGLALIRKPLKPGELLLKIRSILDNKD
jgi:DNA-binding response OmpR family regulator